MEYILLEAELRAFSGAQSSYETNVSASASHCCVHGVFFFFFNSWTWIFSWALQLQEKAVTGSPEEPSFVSPGSVEHLGPGVKIELKSSLQTPSEDWILCGTNEDTSGQDRLDISSGLSLLPLQSFKLILKEASCEQTSLYTGQQGSVGVAHRERMKSIDLGNVISSWPRGHVEGKMHTSRRLLGWAGVACGWETRAARKCSRVNSSNGSTDPGPVANTPAFLYSLHKALSCASAEVASVIACLHVASTHSACQTDHSFTVSWVWYC